MHSLPTNYRVLVSTMYYCHHINCTITFLLGDVGVDIGPEAKDVPVEVLSLLETAVGERDNLKQRENC